MKLLKTHNIESAKCCQQEFDFDLPRVTLGHRTSNFSVKVTQ